MLYNKRISDYIESRISFKFENKLYVIYKGNVLNEVYKVNIVSYSTKIILKLYIINNYTFINIVKYINHKMKLFTIITILYIIQINRIKKIRYVLFSLLQYLRSDIRIVQ